MNNFNSIRHITKAVAMVSVLGCAGAQAAEIVVIGNPTAASLTKEQVADLFLGKSQTFMPVDQADGSAVFAEFYKKATGRDVAQVKSTWSRIVFSGKGQAPKQLADSSAVKKAVAADPKAVGYIEKSAVDGTVKVVLGLD
jgi:ABC-type phosphate transport system substrate-binding protein